MGTKANAQRTALPSGTVTFLLTDVEGSTRLWEARPALAGAALARHLQILYEVMAACGGACPVEQGEGDSTVSAYARPTDAVRAAYRAQRALADEAWGDGASLTVRMAVHTGEVELRNDGTYAGSAINRCARLRALAHGGQVLVSSATRDLVVDHLDDGLVLVDLGAHRLRDLTRPEQVWQLSGAGLVSDFPALASLDATPNNLPVQLSSFVGREEDITRGVALLGETRLLTLTGAGGCGKTRLAQRIAAQLADRHPDGTWWVELASVADGALIGETVAATLGIKPSTDRPAADAVAGHLGEGAALLVLDNCEHLVTEAAAFADHVLRCCPSIAILATSREPLTVEGEVAWRVPSMGLPPVEDASPEALGQYDAVRLFIERAVQARPNFRVTNENAPAVAQICHRLDGIPLALELAAARTRVLPPERIAAELDDRFRLLTGHTRVGVPRQQTLLASVDWSYELLDPLERALLRRLGIFAGGFTLDAAEAVAAESPLTTYDVLDVLARLVDKSLVQFEETGSSVGRYRLLETIRQYALDRLSEAGERRTTADHHLEWAVGFARMMEPEVTNAHVPGLDLLELEHANLRAALEAATGREDRADAYRLIGSLAFFWVQRGHYAEAAKWEAELLDGLAPQDDAEVARARWGCAYVRFYAGDIMGALERATAALGEARAAGDDSTAARCLHTVNTAMLVVDPGAAREGLVEAAALARQACDDWCRADALQIIAYTHLAEGNHRLAEQFLQEAFPIFDALGNEFQRAWHHAGLGWAATLRAELDLAEAEIRRSLVLARRVGDPSVEMTCCGVLAYLMYARGTPGELAPEIELVRSHRKDRDEISDLRLSGLAAVGSVVDDPKAAQRDLEVIAASYLEIGDALDGCQMLIDATTAALEAGQPHDAARLAARAEQCAPTEWYRARARLMHGVAARINSQPEAADLVHQALAVFSASGTVVGVPLALETLAGDARGSGSPVEAARLLGAAESLRERTGQRRLPGEQSRFDREIGDVKAQVGEEFEAAWKDGRALSCDEAVAYASRARGSRNRPSSGWASLTPTEAQVVDLAAMGLTNPQIADRLFMGRGTVKSHLAHIFSKLNVSTRAELAAAKFTGPAQAPVASPSIQRRASLPRPLRETDRP